MASQIRIPASWRSMRSRGRPKVVGKPAYGKGMVSGVKKIETFRPAKIISLN